MFDNNTMNWGKIDSDAVKNQSTSNVENKAFERTVFAKFKAGMHKLRIVPIGNRLENIPYLEIGQHSYKMPNEKGQPTTYFVLCWEFLLSNIKSFESVDDKRTKSLLSYLVGNKKLDEVNQKLYEQHGCPWCKAFQFMESVGIEKNVRNNFFMKQQWLWNVQWKHNGFSGDNKIYVWSISKKHFNHIINVLKQDRQGGIYTLDPNNGFDHSWNATGGNDFSRRYDAPMFERVPSPLQLMPNDVPFDLVEIGCNSLKSYQDSVNLLKRAAGELLSSRGYAIPGDIAVSVPMQYGNPNAMQVPEQNIPAIFVPQALVQPPNPIQPTNVAIQHAPAGVQVQTQAERKDLGGGYYQIGATVYKPDGSVAF